jgi:hypothetical protein
MSIIFRFTERGDGGALGPTRSEPSSIDREKRCFRLKFITPSVMTLIVANILPLAGLHLRHGYQPKGLWAGFGPLLARYCGADEGCDIMDPNRVARC